MALKLQVARLLPNWPLLMPTLSSLFAIGPYGFTDDYTVSIEMSQNPNDAIKAITGTGRPILAILQYLLFRIGNSFDYFVLLHILASLLVFLCTIRFYKSLLSVGITISKSRYVAGSVPLIVPGFLIMQSWLVCIPVLFAVSSTLLAVENYYAGKSVYLFSFYFGLAFFIYQPVGGLALALILVLWPFSSKSKESHVFSFLRFKGLFLLGMIGLIDLMIMKIGKELGWISGQRSSIVKDLNSKYLWFQNEASRTILDIFNPWHRTWVTIFISTIVFLWCASYLIHKHSNYFVYLGLAYLMVTAPSLLTLESWASNRSLMGAQWITALVFVLVVFEIKPIWKFRNLVLLIFTIYGSMSIFLAWRLPQINEIDFIKKSVSIQQCENAKYVKKSEWYQSFTRFTSYDEFGIPSTTQAWSVIPLTVLICKDKGIMRDVQSFSLTTGEAPDSKNTINYFDLLKNKTM